MERDCIICDSPQKFPGNVTDVWPRNRNSRMTSNGYDICGVPARAAGRSAADNPPLIQRLQKRRPQQMVLWHPLFDGGLRRVS